MSLSERPVGEFMAALGERTPTPASGAATALTAALAAALVELAGRFAGDEPSVIRAKALWSRLAELADEDAEAYEAFMAERTEATRARIIAVPEESASAVLSDVSSSDAHSGGGSGIGCLAIVSSITTYLERIALMMSASVGALVR